MSSALCLSLDSSIFGYVLFSIFTFYLGFVINGVPKRNLDSTIKPVNVASLEVFTLLFFCLYIIANVMLYSTSDIPLFSDNATESKISVFTSGTGWIRRIMFFSSFLPIALMILVVFTKKKLFYGSLMLFYMFISILLGSKSGFMGIFLIFWFFYTQKNIWNEGNMQIKNFLKSKMKYLVLGSLLIVVFIVAKEGGKSDEGPIIYSLGFRAMEFGDVMLYYKIDNVRHFFDNYNFINFIGDELNGITGMLKLDTYRDPLGYVMAKTYLGNRVSETVTGPNGLFFVRGHIYFGYIGGLIYCFIMGYLYSLIRKKILGMYVNDLFVYAICIFIFFNLDGALREFSQFISTLFSFFVFTGAFFIISQSYSESLKRKRKKDIASVMS